MITKIALSTAVAATALCLPAMAPSASSSAPVDRAVANVSYSVPTAWWDNWFDRKHRRHNRNGGNVVQAPIQSCGNNIGSNIIIGIGSKNNLVKSSNSGNCSQKTTAR